jgi:hypothetical protein
MKLVEELRGHALSLNLLGRYLRAAHGGDVRRRDRVRFHDLTALAEARRLVEKHGYFRRREELEDLEAAAGRW